MNSNFQQTLKILMLRINKIGNGLYSIKISKMKDILKYVLFVAALFSVIEGGYAITPTQNQIDTLKNMSPTEQKRLADKFGITVPATDDGVKNKDYKFTNPKVVTPRDIENIDSKKYAQDNANRSAKLYKINAPIEKSEDEDTEVKILKPYGYDLFAGSPSTFAPVSDVPVPQNYVIGPGDVVVLQLYGKENITREIVVTREGVLQIPEIGPLSVTGLSYRELKSYLNKVVAEKMIGVNASITMGSLRSIRVFVLGEAHRPGSYTVSSLSTIINAIFFSGGVTELGSLRHIQLKRRGKLVGELDLYDLLLKGDTSADQRLLPGDVIFIPTIGKTVGVSGQVKRPAIYELNSETSTNELVKLAGGLMATAFPEVSRIERINNDGERTLVDVDLTTVEGQGIYVADSDVLRVYSILDTVEKIVVLKGHVKRPGGFAFKAGMRVTDVIASQYGLLPAADLRYSLIVRESQPLRELDISSFDLGKAIDNPGSTMDPVLKNRDQVIVFNGSKGDRQKILKPYLESVSLQTRPDKPAKVVSISGNVRFPGSYPLTEQMSAQDLLLASGGYKESAYKLNAEITRSKVVEGRYQEYERIDIDLGESETIKMRSKDQLFIKKIPNWAGKKTVSIKGEVVFPGIYPIFKGDTIVNLLERAGGFTSFADPNAAIFLRESLKKREAEQLERYKIRLERDLADLKLEKTKSNNNSGEEAEVAENLLSQLVEAEAMGRLVIDLMQIVSRPDEDDIELKNKDILIIPSHSLEVSVLGEIQFPVSHLHQKNKGVFDYIKNSGGYTSKSDKKRIFVVKPNGSVKPVKRFLFIKSNVKVNPGDTVVVPYDTYSVSPMAHWSNVSTILFQLASVAASLKTLGAI